MTLTEFLSDRNIRYRTKGKNIGRGFIGVQCPYCFDSNNHCGLAVDKPYFNCFVCSSKGNLAKYIRQITNYSWRKCYEIQNSIFPEELEDEENVTKGTKDESKFYDLYNQFSEKFSKAHKQYLISRNFDIDELKRKYSILSCSEFPSRYSFRVIAPIIYQNKVVHFIGRDITDKSEQRYLYCPDRLALIPRRNLLYNIDNVSNKIIIVEGVTDVWRIGTGSVATFTTTWTKEQVLEICKLNLKAAFVLFDSEEAAQKKAQKLCDALSLVCRIPHVERIELPDDINDPGDMSEQDIRYLKKELF